MQSKIILILGGGFGGINCALKLRKKLRKSKEEYRIILVDQNDYHLYTPTLYEVATAEEEFTSLNDLKHSIAIWFNQYLPKDIMFLQERVELIDQTNKQVFFASGKNQKFDYLVVALGSTSDFFNIPGLKEHSLTMKSLGDALKVRNAVEFLVKRHQMNLKKDLLRIVVGGGGFSGVELAAELVNLLLILSWKYNYNLEKLQVMIFEGAAHLLPGLDEELSDRVRLRLERMPVPVHIHAESLISNVTDKQITTNGHEVINYDLLIWTGGVRSVEIPFQKKVQVDTKSRLVVGSNLNLYGSECIFAIGDNACIYDINKRSLPQTAQQAIYQAEYVADVIAKKIKGQQVDPFMPKVFAYIISVRGKWAVMHWPMGLSLYGLFPWLARNVADFNYFHMLMPFWKAAHLAWFDVKVYIRND